MAIGMMKGRFGRKTDAMVARWKSREYREKMLAHMKARWADESYKGRVALAISDAQLSSPSLRRQRREKLEARWQEDGWRELHFRTRSLWFIPRDIRDILSRDEVSLLCLPEVRRSIIAATATALNMEVPNE